MRFWFSLSTLLFSIGFTLYGLNTLSMYDLNGRPGPGYFPLIIGVALVICTGINVYKDLKELRSKQAVKQDKELYQKDTFAVAVCIALLIFTLNSLGAIVSWWFSVWRFSLTSIVANMFKTSRIQWCSLWECSCCLMFGYRRDCLTVCYVSSINHREMCHVLC